MTDGTGEQDFESRLERALEAAPAVKIPEGFALRMAAMAPSRVAATQAANARRSVGHQIAWVVAALLLLAMFVLAPSAGVGARRWVEFALEIDFVALTLWLGMRSLAASR